MNVRMTVSCQVRLHSMFLDEWMLLERPLVLHKFLKDASHSLTLTSSPVIVRVMDVLLELVDMEMSKVLKAGRLGLALVLPDLETVPPQALPLEEQVIIFNIQTNLIIKFLTP